MVVTAADGGCGSAIGSLEVDFRGAIFGGLTASLNLCQKRFNTPPRCSPPLAASAIVDRRRPFPLTRRGEKERVLAAADGAQLKVSTGGSKSTVPRPLARVNLDLSLKRRQSSNHSKRPATTWTVREASKDALLGPSSHSSAMQQACAYDRRGGHTALRTSQISSCYSSEAERPTGTFPTHAGPKGRVKESGWMKAYACSDIRADSLGERSLVVIELCCVQVTIAALAYPLAV